VDIWKSPSPQYRRDKVAVRTTCIKNINLRLSKYELVVSVSAIYTTVKTYWSAQILQLGCMWPEGRGLDIAGSDKRLYDVTFSHRFLHG